MNIVEVRLLQRRHRLFYSKKQKKLGGFKEKLVKDIFPPLSRSGNVQQAFVLGSFLTQKADYDDIDLLLATDRPEVEKIVYEKLADTFGLKFHIICIAHDRLVHLLESCPLTRSMLYYSISDKRIPALPRRKLDRNHIRFLLMMPEDILEISVSSRSFYDSLRRLLTIERFLKNMDEDPLRVNDELKKTLGDAIFEQLRGDEAMDEKTMEKTRTLIRSKLHKIGQVLENGQNENHP